MTMALERRIAFAVFAVGVLLALLALTGRGDDIDSPELSAGCQETGTQGQDYAAQAPGSSFQSARVSYANSSPTLPCAMSLDGTRLTLFVADPENYIMDLRVHCAEVELEGISFKELEDGTSNNDQLGTDQAVLEDALEQGCARVPLID
jgi:hypothetical protein